MSVIQDPGPPEDFVPQSFSARDSIPRSREGELSCIDHQRMRFDEFICSTYDHSLADARRLCGDPALAEDLLQESYLRIWRRSKLNIEDDVVELRVAYVKVVVRNVFYDFLRKRKKEEEYSAEVDGQRVERFPEDSAQRAADRARVLKFLRQLPPRHREIYFLNTAGGLGPAEIATFLGLAPGTVSNYLSLARRRIQEMVSKMA